MTTLTSPTKIQLDRIVVATNLSDHSAIAIRYAESLAKRFSSWVTFAHVVDLSAGTLTDAEAFELPVEAQRRVQNGKLEALLSTMALAGIRTTGQTIEGRTPAASIVMLAEDLKADLILMGTHGLQGLNKAIRGSVAEGVIHHSTCPVMTIGPRVKMRSLDEISLDTVVLATDLSSDATQKTSTALTLIDENVGKIYLCHILKRGGKDICETLAIQFRVEEELGKLIPQSAYEWCNSRCVVEQGNAAEHILKLAHRVNADVIVLGAKRSASWFARLGNGVVEDILSESECPVLTVCASQ
jgi:nucleotide-binding universal stress UspA family protein